MTLDEIVNSMTSLRDEMRRKNLRTDMPCYFYPDHERSPVHITLVKSDFDRLVVNPEWFIADGASFIGIP